MRHTEAVVGERSEGDVVETSKGAGWQVLEEASVTLLQEVAQMVESLGKLPSPADGPASGDDLARSKLLRDHQRLNRYLTSLLEDVVQLATAGVAGAAHLLGQGSVPLTAAARAERWQASQVLERLTTVSDQVMLARRQVTAWIRSLETTEDREGRDDHRPDEQAWQLARAQTTQLLQRLRPHGT